MPLQSLQRRIVPSKRHNVPLEHYEQASFMQRLAWLMPHLLQFVAAVPNGEKRSKATGARLKRQGVRKAFPDVVVVLARNGYFGLLIEFKRQGVTRADDEQEALHALYRAQGYQVELCAGCDVAWGIFLEYVRGEVTLAQAATDGTVGDARASVFDV